MEAGGERWRQVEEGSRRSNPELLRRILSYLLRTESRKSSVCLRASATTRRGEEGVGGAMRRGFNWTGSGVRGRGGGRRLRLALVSTHSSDTWGRWVLPQAFSFLLQGEETWVGGGIQQQERRERGGAKIR